jgi:hypothetical protein
MLEKNIVSLLLRFFQDYFIIIIIIILKIRLVICTNFYIKLIKKLFSYIIFSLLKIYKKIFKLSKYKKEFFNKNERLIR